MKIIVITFLLSMSMCIFAAKEKSSDKTVDMKKMFETLQSQMKDEIADAKKCAAIVSKVCGELSLNDCMMKKAGSFPSHCREQFAQVNETKKDIMATMKPCLDKAMKACPMPEIDPSKDVSSFNKSYQDCMKSAMQKDKACVALMEKKAKELTDPENKTNDAYKVFVR